MKLKKIFALLLSLCMISGSFVAVSAEDAEELTTITVGSLTDVAPGSTITVPISISNNGDDDEWNLNNTGIAGIVLNITYDPDVFTYVKAVAGDALTSLTFTPPGSISTPGSLGCVWDGMANDNTDGVIANFRFTVADTVTSGDYEIAVSVRGAVKLDGTTAIDLELATENGAVTVAGDCGHSYDEEITTAATCTDTGVKTYTCSLCGDSYTEEIAVIGHSYQATVKMAATCTDTGAKTYTCSLCGDTYTEEIEALGHNMTFHAQVDATCTEKGVVAYYVCSLCDEIFEDEDGTVILTDIVIPAKGHRYGKWVTNGYDTHSKECDECGDIQTEAHAWNDGAITQMPTYRKTGIKTYTCSGCGGTMKETLDVLTAEESDTNVTVGSATVRNGREITVPVTVSNNVGFAGLQITVEYDTDALTITGVERGEGLDTLEFTISGDINTGCLTLLWDGTDIDSSNGDIAYITFLAAEDAVIGDYSLILDAYIACDSKLNDIPVYLTDGNINVIEYKPGDPNDDGEVNVRDVILTRQYIVGGYDAGIVFKAAEVTRDGVVNVKDVILMRQYIVGGYGVELQ